MLCPFSFVFEKAPSLPLMKIQKTCYVDIRTNATMSKTNTVITDCFGNFLLLDSLMRSTNTTLWY